MCRLFSIVFVAFTAVLLMNGSAQGQLVTGKRYAVIVTVQFYEHAGFRNLNHADNDGTELRDVLAQAGYDIVLLSATAGKTDEKLLPTLANVQTQLKAKLDKCKRDDLALVAFAGHGLQIGAANDKYFCVRDSKPNNVKTMLPLADVYRRMKECGAGTKLLLMDACHNDPTRDPARGLDKPGLPPEGIAALFSCSEGEFAFEADKYQHGVFFYHVIQGLKGKAKDEENNITWDSLRTYVKKSVTRDVNEQFAAQGGKQRPHEAGTLSGEPPILQTLRTGNEPFPRRLLAITPANYLYANSIAYGGSNPLDEKSRRDTFQFIDKLATNWKIPADQRYYISDGPLADQKVDIQHPPLKSVISGSIDTFLKSCRPQDRIVIVFAGHAVEKDGEAFLVPQEGELDDVSTLIPVKEFYDKLAKCPAQEKLIIYDVCRFDPGRGAERPIFGAMTESLEKALHNSPEGVSVWTSCSAGQFSYESEYYQVNIKGLRNVEIFGSVFFNVMFADAKAALSKSATGRGIQLPEDRLPIQPLADYVNEFVKNAVEDIENKPQTPKLTYKHRGDTVAYDPKQLLAAKKSLTDVPPGADSKAVAAMFDEFRVPAIKATRKDVSDLKPGESFPFAVGDVKEYAFDGVTEEEIKTNPQKYPLRAAVIEARDAIRDMRQKGESEGLPEEFRVLPGDNANRKILAIQRQPAKLLAILGEQRDKLEAAGSNRTKEKSIRWQANYDYILAQVKARQVYLNQYNLMLGKVRKDELPLLIKDEGKGINQNGWRLAAIAEINGDAEGRRLAQQVKESLDTIINEHPRTPWSMQAKRERSLGLGLQWQGVTFK